MIVFRKNEVYISRNGTLKTTKVYIRVWEMCVALNIFPFGIWKKKQQGTFYAYLNVDLYNRMFYEKVMI